MGWFRVYEEVVEDPKVQRLSPELFRTWINLLCVASKHGGQLPSVEDMAYALRLDSGDMQQRLDTLAAAGLLDRRRGTFTPHNWNGRQYKSDSSSNRVRAFRERKRNVSPPLPETPPDQIQSRADTEPDTEADAEQLPEIALAQKIAESISWTENIQPIAGAIKFCVEQENKTRNEAVTFLMIEARRVIAQGGFPDRFWWTGRKWRNAGNGTSHSSNQANQRVQKSTDEIRRAVAARTGSDATGDR